MKKFLKILGLLLLVLIVAAVVLFFYFKPAPPPISEDDRARVEIMPLPASLEYGKGFIEITKNFGVKFENEPNDKLKNAVDRLYKQLGQKTQIQFTDRVEDILEIKNVNLENNEYPIFGENESYELTISKGHIVLRAPSTTGIIYGLETLVQIVESKEDQFIFPVLEIKDQPRYPWRGLMLDVSRHWMPKEVVLRNLDAMAKLKMNVFHWHLSDYQGFRVESKKFPKLHEMGSQGNYYTQEEIKEIINYASERGIRVVPEFDVPGHATSWLAGYPELGSAPGPYSIDTLALGLFRPVLDPTNPKLYAFLDDFLAEMVTLFPDKYFHIGGDEVMAKDWEDNEKIQKYMGNNNIEDSHQLQAHFNIRLQKIIAKHNKIMLGWDEIQHPDLPVDGITIQAWRSHKVLWESARKGNKTILSKGYYLDHKKRASEYYNIDPEIIKGAINIDIDSVNWTSWTSQIHFGGNEFDGNIYTFGKDDDIQIIMEFMESATSISDVDKNGNSINFTNKIDVGNMNVALEIVGDSIIGEASIALFDLKLTGKRSGGSDMPDGLALPKFDKIEPLSPEELKNIIGGEACMWSEMVDSVTLESRVWPKAAAIAEKLWSPKELTKDNEDMYRRLILMNQYLEETGLEHRKNQETILKDMVDQEFIQPLNFLVDYLNEGAFLNRISMYEPTLYTGTSLNYIVDAASAESYPAYKFNKLVDLWLSNKEENQKNEIVLLLKQWIQNHEQLTPLFDTNDRVKMVESHSENLAVLSKLALKTIEGEALNPSENSSIDALLKDAHLEHGGTVLAVVPGLEKIIQSNN